MNLTLRIFFLLLENKPLKNKEISEKLNTNIRNVQRIIENLKLAFDDKTNVLNRHFTFNGGGQFDEFRVYSQLDYGDVIGGKDGVEPEKTVSAKYSVALDTGATSEVYFLGNDNNIYYEMFGTRPEIELAPNIDSAYHMYYGQ